MITLQHLHPCASDILEQEILHMVWQLQSVVDVPCAAADLAYSHGIGTDRYQAGHAKNSSPHPTVAMLCLSASPLSNSSTRGHAPSVNPLYSARSPPTSRCVRPTRMRTPWSNAACPPPASRLASSLLGITTRALLVVPPAYGVPGLLDSHPVFLVFFQLASAHLLSVRTLSSSFSCRLRHGCSGLVGSSHSTGTASRAETVGWGFELPAGTKGAGGEGPEDKGDNDRRARGYFKIIIGNRSLFANIRIAIINHDPNEEATSK
jgi:hypothetical protein